jgi:hypothetical protein
MAELAADMVVEEQVEEMETLAVLVLLESSSSNGNSYPISSL